MKVRRLPIFAACVTAMLVGTVGPAVLRSAHPRRERLASRLAAPPTPAQGLGVQEEGTLPAFWQRQAGP